MGLLNVLQLNPVAPQRTGGSGTPAPSPDSSRRASAPLAPPPRTQAAVGNPADAQANSNSARPSPPRQADATMASPPPRSPAAAPNEPGAPAGADLARQISANPGRLRGRPAAQLIAAARELDRQLMSGALEHEPARVVQAVDALLAIGNDLQARPMRDLAQWRTKDSPLDGIIEDILPFGAIDQWTVIRSTAAARLRATRPQRPPAPRQGPAPAGPVDPQRPGPARADPDLRAARQAGREIARDINTRERPVEIGGMSLGTGEQIGRGLDAAGNVLDLLGLCEVAAAETIGLFLLPVAALASEILFLWNLAQTAENVEKRLESAAMRYAAISLTFPFRPYPDQLTVSILLGRLNISAEYRLATTEGRHYGINSVAETNAVPRRGLDKVCKIVNRAVRQMEAHPGNAAVLSRATNAAQRREILQIWRRVTYQSIGEAVLRAAPPPGA